MKNSPIRDSVNISPPIALDKSVALMSSQGWRQDQLGNVTSPVMSSTQTPLSI
jgi:hypothetical protein